MIFRTVVRLIPLLCLASVAGAQTTGPTVQLDPYVVNAELDQARAEIVPSLGATEYFIGPNQIGSQSLGPAASFNQVLLRVPGMAEDSYGQVHLRGEHANLQYRINDVLLPEGITGFGQELDTPMVENVSVITGSLPAQYGDRTAGVVDIHTRTGSAAGDAGAVSVSAGSSDTLRTDVSASGANGPLSAFVLATAKSNDAGIENPTASQTPLHDRTRQDQIFGDFSWLTGSSARLSLLLGGSTATFQIPDNPGQAPQFALEGVPSFDSAGLNENQREDNGFAILSLQKSDGPVNAQASVFTRYSLVEFEPDVDGDLIFNGVSSHVYQDIATNGVQADASWSVTPAHTLRAGGSVASENAGTSTRDAVFPLDPSGDPTDVPESIGDDSRRLGWLAGAYVQDEWQAFDHLTLNLGARADESDAYLDEGQLSPRANAVYALGDSTDLHAGYARYFTPPPLELVQPSDLAKFAGTTNAPAVDTDSPVHSERADYYDAGISHAFSPHFNLALDGYDKRAVNQLDLGQFGAALIYAPFNYQEGRIAGAELSGTYTQGGLNAYANLAHSRALGQTITSGQYQFAPDELTYIADHWVHLDHDQALTASTGVSWRFDGNLVLADLLYGSGLRSGFANTDHLPDYHPLNLGYEHDLSTRSGPAGASGPGHTIRLRLDVTNVFDESYELRDGSGIGVFAPQYGPRRGLFATVGIPL